MKKISLLAISSLAAITSWAQTDVVKEVERALKQGSPDYEQAIKTITPALANPETANSAQAWYLAGKANFGLYDQLYIQESLGNALNTDQKKKAGHALLDGYGNYFTAIPLDATPDEKGKVKPKYTKDMLKAMKSNYGQLRNAGVYLFEAQDFKAAYDAWETYVNLPTNPALGKETPDAEPDTVVGQIMYYQLLAALSCDENRLALDKVAQIEKSGYKNMDVYVYGIEAARRLNDSIAMQTLARKGYEEYGTQNIQFVGQLINEHLQKNDFVGCYDLVNKAIAATPDDNTAIKSQLYDIMGVVCEQQEKIDDAIANFDKAIELNPEIGKSYYDKARIIYNQAVRLDETVENAADRDQQVKPKLLEAAQLFEKAYGLDQDNLNNIPNILYRLYYRLGDGYQDKADYWKDM